MNALLSIGSIGYMNRPSGKRFSVGRSCGPVVIAGIACACMLWATAGVWGAPTNWEWVVWDGLAENDNGVSPSVAIHPGNGGISVAFYAGTLKWARLTATGWLTETADSGSQDGIYPSLAYDSRGVPHIAYEDYPNFRYATRNNETGLWSDEDAASYGAFSDLILDADDQPHASFVGWAGDRTLYYATKRGGTWNSETVDDGAIIYYNSTGIALDPTGFPHIVYSVVTGAVQEVRHAERTESGWRIETIASAASVGRGPAICVDRSGSVHVSVYDDGKTDLLYARKSGGTWTVSVADPTAASEGQHWHARTAIALLSDGTPVIAYFDNLKEELRCAVRDGEAWIIQTVDTSGRVGETPSIAIATNDQPVIAYHDCDRNFFKLAVGVHAAVPCPTLSRFSSDGDQVHITVTGLTPGVPTSVERAFDLRSNDWSEVGSFTAPTYSMEWAGVYSNDWPSVFYRTRNAY